jgi:hypothetical protein
VSPKPAAIVGLAVVPVPPEKVELIANEVASAGLALLTNVSKATRVLVIVQVTANCAAVPVAGITRPEKAIAPVEALVTTPPLEANTVPSPLVHCQNILNDVKEFVGGNVSSPNVIAPLATDTGVVVPLFPTLFTSTTPFCNKSNL